MKARGYPTLAGVAVWIALATPFPAVAQEDSDPTDVISGQLLLEDFGILERAYRELHPGLYRYNTPVELASHFEILRTELEPGLSTADAYLAFSRLLAKLRCGHTYANFFNQSEEVQTAVFGRRDKLPFTFRIVAQRMIVTADASVDQVLAPGTEVLFIDGVPVHEILRGLLPYVAADGSNDGKRWDELQLTGVGDFEYFDVFFPLVYAPTGEHFSLEITDATGPRSSVSVSRVTRPERRERLAARYGPRPNSVDELWEFVVWDSEVAYLKIGSFVTWRMEMDWRAFLRDAFDTLREQDIPNLVLDLRGNAGGDDAVRHTLRSFLQKRDIDVKPERQLLRYRIVPPDLRPHVDTWEDGFVDRGDRVVAVEGGYTFRGLSTSAQRRPARPDAYGGRTFVVVGPANSSSTLTLASTIQTHGLATLVGRETGGNQRGINGGQYFFLRLPNSGIEMDIPLIGYFAGEDKPDRGIEPDVLVEPSLADIRAGIDTELEAVKRLIAQTRMDPSDSHLRN